MIENDILLIDISNNDKYTWTNIFYASTPKTSSSLLIIIGAVVGSLIGGIFLSFEFFYINGIKINRDIENH